MGEAARQRFTFDEYVQLEEMSVIKHEYLDGHVWAMAGGTPDHAGIIASVTAILSAQLRGRPCRVFGSDLRIRVRETGLGTYPDVTVVCGRLLLDPEDRSGSMVINPRVIVEVMSPSTAEYDRGEKLAHYQRIDGLAEIVLVGYEGRSIEVVRRDGSAWSRTTWREGAAEIASIGCVLPVDEVFHDPLREA